MNRVVGPTQTCLNSPDRTQPSIRSAMSNRPWSSTCHTFERRPFISNSQVTVTKNVKSWPDSLLSRPDSGSLSVRSDPVTFQSLFLWPNALGQQWPDVPVRPIAPSCLCARTDNLTWRVNSDHTESGLVAPSSVWSLNQSHTLSVAYDQT
jgi:hypothetical protein